jgi:hypothetical protein
LAHLNLFKESIRAGIEKIKKLETQEDWETASELKRLSEGFGTFSTEELITLEKLRVYRPERLAEYFSEIEFEEVYFEPTEKKTVQTGSLLYVKYKDSGEVGSIFHSSALDLCFGFIGEHEEREVI